MAEHPGGCHCGNLRLTLRLSQAPGDVRLRACGCSFCRAHNTRTASDPYGAVDIWADDWSLVERYRFGTGTGAVGDTASGTRAVINTNCRMIALTLPISRTPPITNGEATEDRLTRRAANWTPATLHR
jgi:hypothetical protein